MAEAVAEDEQTPKGADKWRERGEAGKAHWYLTFISIVFGVFISVWIEPVVQIFPDSGTATDIKTTIGLLFTEKTFRGAVMFLMLICLWWWYGMFLGRVAPANQFWDYLYDFISLCAFAVAFRMWGHPSVFPLIVFVAAGLMLGRFLSALRFVVWGTVQAKALVTALIALVLFMVGALSAFGLALYTGIDAFLKKDWWLVEYGTVALLIVGICATFAAVIFTDGMPFRADKPVADKPVQE